MNKVNFWRIRIFVFIYVRFRIVIGEKWIKVKGIYLPLNTHLVFNTLRWIVNGKYEEGEIQLISEKLNKADKVLEIGTGLGFVSTFCANVVGSENVFTFEANPYNIEIASQVFEKNGVSPFVQNALLSDFEGEIDFPINKKSILASSLNKTSDEFAKVNSLNLNELVKKISPNFLIMDIEGAEYEVFKIIQFQSIEKIQFELHPTILNETKVSEIFSILDKNHFILDKCLKDGRNYFYVKKQF
jgi:FkbM family methyltransferase